jgi:hypothetical protein
MQFYGGCLLNFWKQRKRFRARSRESISNPRPWKDLYIEALLEGDKDRVPARIAQAEQAIAQRARELFNVSGDHFKEQEDLGEALYALHALKSCLAVHGRFADIA